MTTQHTHPNDPAPGQRNSTATQADHPVGIVYKKTGTVYTVQSNGRSLPCTLSKQLHKPDQGSFRAPGKAGKERRRPADRIPEPQPDANSVVVGDLVRLEERQAGAGTIIAVLPRRNKIARRSAVPMPGAHAFEQVIAANMDQVVPVFAAADPAPKWNLLDRYLVSAEAAGVPALVLISKIDLAPEDPQDGFWLELDTYRRIGYPLVTVSALSGVGLEQLREALSGRLSVLLGKSGVGKTTLLNALQPGLGLRVNSVSQATGKGKHTTTHQEMFRLQTSPGEPDASNSGGAIVDTPGVREFGLWEIYPDDLALFFPEMRPLVGHCRFGLDCGHDEEPGCAIRKAVMAGQISPRRYQSYLHLKEDI
jgi:ribosome biogenesis GTPase / thiamine phosphate phosphatase